MLSDLRTLESLRSVLVTNEAVDSIVCLIQLYSIKNKHLLLLFRVNYMVAKFKIRMKQTVHRLDLGV